MQRISTALSALISRKQYRLKHAPKVTKTGRQMTKLSRACHRGLAPQSIWLHLIMHQTIGLKH